MIKKNEKDKGRKQAAESLPDDPKTLKRMLIEEQARVAVLREVNRILKGRGGSWVWTRTPSEAGTLILTARERTEVILTLRPTFRLPLLLRILSLAHSSFTMSGLLRSSRGDTLCGMRSSPAGGSCYGGWGYRRVHHQVMEETGRRHLSARVVRKIMGTYGLLPPYVKPTRHYNSQEGELSPAPPNLIHRNFHASRPNMLWLTDISKMNLDGYKAYLSAIIDCCDGKAVAWKVYRHPNAALANSTLLDAVKTLHPGEHSIIHSDRGGHYRWCGWKSIFSRYGLIRSKSAKGCSPDNLAMEGFFVRLKNEFFYYREWKGVLFDDFKKQIGDWICYYNTRREKESLGWNSPDQYRKDLDLMA